MDIEKLAREAQRQQDWTGHDAAPYDTFTFNEDGLRRLVEAVRRETAEEAAKAAEEAEFTGNRFPVSQLEQMRYDCAAAIRERFKA